MSYPSVWRAAAYAIAAALALSPVADAKGRKAGLLEQAVDAYEARHTFDVPAAGRLEVGFSPNEGSEALVIKVIDAARTELRMMAYSFTSAPVTEALIRARRRGVDVKLVVDERNNTSEDRSGKARAALSALINAGAEVRVIGVYAIAHDKVIIVDRATVELGSFNYSAAAASRNSENVLVNWDNPKLAEVYVSHWERNYRLGRLYRPQY